jgi:ribonuclease P protein component
MVKQNGLPRAEKLKSRKLIDGLFAQRSSLQVPPFRVKFRFIPAGASRPGLQMGVTVGKTHFKKAVDRNRVKRLVREAWRLQKAPLAAQITAAQHTGLVFFIYTDRQTAEFDTLLIAMGKCIIQLQQKAIHEKAS